MAYRLWAFRAHDRRIQWREFLPSTVLQSTWVVWRKATNRSKWHLVFWRSLLPHSWRGTTFLSRRPRWPARLDGWRSQLRTGSLEVILEGSSELCLFLFEACCFATQEPTGTLGFWFHEYPERKADFSGGQRWAAKESLADETWHRHLGFRAWLHELAFTAQGSGGGPQKAL